MQLPLAPVPKTAIFETSAHDVDSACSGRPDRLAGRHRALDRDGRFQVDPGLLGRGVNGRRSGREMIEPGARLVAERAPEIAHRPVARGVAAEEGHLHPVIRHIGMRHALSEYNR